MLPLNQESKYSTVFQPMQSKIVKMKTPLQDQQIAKLSKMIHLEKEKLKFKKFNKDPVWKNYKMFQKSIGSKMKSFKFKSSKPSKKFFKTMENKIQKMIVGKKESHKSVKTVKKQIQKTQSSQQKQLFSNLSAPKRKQKLVQVKQLLTRLANQRYSDFDFKMTNQVFAEFTETLAQFLNCESDKCTKQVYSKLARNVKVHYDRAKESLALQKCLSKRYLVIAD